ncbi:MAG: DNA repair protein RadC [Gammaproteobacteria bacterium]|nr:DNA repair protein RadC [Gammaproteobacteria bacterium]
MKKHGFIKDQHGNYITARPVSDDDIINLYKGIISRRFQRGKAISSPRDIKELFVSMISDYDHEVFLIAFLDTRHRIIAIEEMFRGTIDGCEIHPRIVVKRALELNAAATILAHCHPSGDTSPSNADKRITQRLKEALSLVDTRVLDHIIVGGLDTASFAEMGLL